MNPAWLLIRSVAAVMPSPARAVRHPRSLPVACAHPDSKYTFLHRILVMQLCGEEPTWNRDGPEPWQARQHRPTAPRRIGPGGVLAGGQGADLGYVLVNLEAVLRCRGAVDGKGDRSPDRL